MFCVYTLRQHPLYTLASLVAYTLLQPLRITKGARPTYGLKYLSNQYFPEQLSLPRSSTLRRRVFVGRRLHVFCYPKTECTVSVGFVFLSINFK
jgi:hypothetical protein